MVNIVSSSLQHSLQPTFQNQEVFTKPKVVVPPFPIKMVAVSSQTLTVQKRTPMRTFQGGDARAPNKSFVEISGLKEVKENQLVCEPFLCIGESMATRISLTHNFNNNNSYINNITSYGKTSSSIGCSTRLFNELSSVWSNVIVGHAHRHLTHDGGRQSPAGDRHEGCTAIKSNSRDREGGKEEEHRKRAEQIRPSLLRGV